VNLVGLRRAGVPNPSRDALRKACRYMFFSEMNLTQAIEKIRAEVEMTPELEYLIAFMEQIRHGRNGRALDQPDAQMSRSVVILTGEASGDLYGADLAQSLRARFPEIALHGRGRRAYAGGRGSPACR
jgi:hypothetical protein